MLEHKRISVSDWICTRNWWHIFWQYCVTKTLTIRSVSVLSRCSVQHCHLACRQYCLDARFST